MNRNFGLPHSKWICNHCGIKNIDNSIKTYIFNGTLLYLCDNCMNNWDNMINVMEHKYVEECDYL